MMTNRPVEKQSAHSYAAEKINVKSAISANLLIMLAINHYPTFCSASRIILFHIFSELVNRFVNKLIHILAQVFTYSS
jgi:hypothetical protein